MLRAPYEGAQQSRFTEDWIVGDYMPRELTSSWLTILRQRSRDLARHAPPFVSALDLIVDNVVGTTGFRVNATPLSDAAGDQVDEQLKQDLESQWHEWITECDHDRRESLTMLLRTMVREYIEAGEVFVLETTEASAGDGPVPLSLELVPAEQIDHNFEAPLGRRDPQVPEGHRIRHGIEYDRSGRRAAYWMTKLDEWGSLCTDCERIPASRIHHLYHRSRAKQERGIPWLAGATLLCHDLDDLLDTELTGAQVAACLTAFIQQESTPVFGTEQERDADDNRPISRLAPAMIGYLKPGETIQTVNPNRPSGSFEPFAGFILRSLARTLGTSYESISGDYRNVNFASGRLGHLAERKTYRRIQDIVVQLVLRPVWQSFVRHLFAADRAGAISPLDFDLRRRTRAEFGAPGWEHHDPLKEANSAALRILASISTLDEECAALGRDWRAILVQRAREIQEQEKLKIPILSSAGGAQIATGQGAPGAAPAPAGGGEGEND